MRNTFLSAVAALTVLAAGPAPAPAVVPDLLDLPAVTSPRAAASLQLAVTRAGNRLVSVGEAGIVLLSDDDGASWRQAAAVPVSVTLTAVTFADARAGWAVGHGGVILHSADGGETWNRQLDGTAAAALAAEEAETLAAAGTPGAAAARRNAARLVADGPDKPFLCVHFADTRHGWVGGAYGLALATEDGGRSWRSFTARLPNPGGAHLYAIAPVGNRLVIAGEQGTLFASPHDGSDGFAAVGTPYDGTFFGVLPLADGGVLAFGLKGNAWRGAPGLADWTPLALGQDATLTAGLRLSDGALVLGDEAGRLLRAGDGADGFVPLAVQAPAGLTGMAQAADGALVVSGPRGTHRAAPPALARETR